VLPALIRKFHLAKLASNGDWQAIQKDESLYGPVPDDVLASLISISKAHRFEAPMPAARLSRAKSRGCQLPSDPAVTLWGTGSPKREFLHVDDLADACLFLMALDEQELRSLLTAERFPLINIGWGKDISVKELAMIIKDIVGFAGDIVFDTTKPDGTPRKLLDVARMAELGWKAKIPLKEGIEHTYSWYLGNSGN
jgi:GDP-L-fucose synthase